MSSAGSSDPEIKVEGCGKVLGLAVCVSVPACGGDEIERPRFLSGEVPIEYPLQMWDQDMDCLLYTSPSPRD